MIVLVPFLVCLIGLVLYFAATGKVEKIGGDMFWVGLLVTLATLGSSTVSLFK